MFQTDINHFFQSFESHILNLFMQGITALGYGEFFMLFLVIILFGFDFKKGFILLQVTLWTGIITTFFKDFFALPRPFHVDNTLHLLDFGMESESDVPFKEKDAHTFWGKLPDEVVNHYRQGIKKIPYGFPSGHTSIATTLWGTVFQLFRLKWVKYTCISLIILIPLSRIYLGVHFLADVLGGYLLGSIILGFLFFLVLSPKPLNYYLSQNYFHFKSHLITFILFLLAPILLKLLFPSLNSRILGALLGFNIGFIWISHKGMPKSPNTIQSGFFRIILAFIIFISLSVFSKKIFPSGEYWGFIRYTFSNGLFLIFTVCLSKALNLYASRKEI